MRVGQRSHNASGVPVKPMAKQPKTSSRHAAALPKPTHSTLPLSPTKEWDDATLADFTKWNEQAMDALRHNDGTTSRRILTSLLPELHQRLRRAEASKSAAGDTLVQSWRLVYALTLNNYGCQLRRDGETTEALQQFQLAQKVESAVFGKPSCSTMLNLSAVLLARGEVKEALAIATECAAAAQDGEPVLFITALHNLAVALGQQSSERYRNAALPTMLQALRESQAALGEQHPTTAMLKEKCGLTAQWINSASVGTLPPPESAPSGKRANTTAPPASVVPAPAAPCSRPDLPYSSAQERARAALYTLSFNPSASDAPSVELKGSESALVPMDNHPSTGRDHALGSATGASDMHHASYDQERSRRATSPECGAAANEAPTTPESAERGSASRVSQDLRGSPDQMPLAVDSGMHRDSNVAVSVDRQCLDSANLSILECSSATGAFEMVLQEPFQASALAFSRHGATTLRDLCGAEQGGSVVYPSFLRFSSHVPPVTASGKQAAMAKTSDASVRVAAEGKALADNGHIFAQTAPAEVSSPHQFPNIAASTPLPGAVNEDKKLLSAPASAPAAQQNDTQSKPKKRVLFGQGSVRRPDKAAQRQAALEEEKAYRQKLKDEEAAAEASRAFERGLEAVKERTQHRAASVIQRAWHQWWTSVGQPRRHVQLQRLEELQRRRRDRLALSSATARKATSKSRAVTVPPPPAQQHGRIAGFIAPAVVLRCARKWLERTACVRCVARSNACPVDARLHEADIRRRICRLQALWRGALQRSHDARATRHPSTQDLRRADAEAREYAAMVVQSAYRRYAARQVRRRLYSERHDGVAAKIQRWLRTTWADHRQREVDGPTLRRRCAAALCIQRMWRGYLGRLAFRMRELRLRIDRACPNVALIVDAAGERNGITSPALTIATNKTSAEARTIVGPSSAVAICDESAQPESGATAASSTFASHPQRRLDGDYEANCVKRSGAVQRLRDEERDNFHIPLYVETMASKERAAWHEAIRLRPTEVVRRRAEHSAKMEAQQARFTCNRAAQVIQRAYRDWNAMRRDASRDTKLLQYSRMRYQQQELGRAVERKQHARDVSRAVQLYGDSTLPMRLAHEEAAATLRAAALSGQGSSEDALVIGAAASATFLQPLAVRTAQQLREQEALLRRDERLLALTHAHNEVHLREGPAECAARLGTTYEHPYYNPYVNEEHRRTLGID